MCFSLAALKHELQPTTAPISQKKKLAFNPNAVGQLIAVLLLLDPVAENEFFKNLKKTGLIIGAGGGVGALLLPTLGTAILTGVGFTSGGIAAGSTAAGIQAGIGNVAAGSAFAMFQSIGATGGFAIFGPVGVVGCLVGVGAGFAYSKFKNKGKPPKFVIVYLHV